MSEEILHGLDPLDAPPPVERKKRMRPIDIIGPLMIFALFLGLWEYIRRDGLRRFFNKPKFLVPSPVTVVDKFFSNKIIHDRLIGGLGWTTLVSVIGLLIAIIIGIALAVLLSQSKWIERSIFPYMVALQAIPILAIVPLIGTVLGYGMSARIFVCVMISIFPIVTNTLFGLMSAESSQHDLFTLRKASRWTRLRKLQFPAAMPSIFTGFRISAGLSVIGAVVGEQLFQQGSKPGLGIVMDQFRQKAIWEGTYAGLIIASLLGIFMFVFFGWLSKVVVGHWYESNRS
ncbi:MAG TPA: ABC transporter permease subunit [Ilumatobacteraceae bacterium]|nr:ABC transporter permease subunit [Ilumatobacteraceae bacterium]